MPNYQIVGLSMRVAKPRSNASGCVAGAVHSHPSLAVCCSHLKNNSTIENQDFWLYRMIHFTIFLVDFFPSYIAKKKYKELSGKTQASTTFLECNWIAGFEGVQVHGKNRPATRSLSISGIGFHLSIFEPLRCFLVAGQPTKNKGLTRPLLRETHD